jgi:2-polyprenyl-6-methoxyphenol hydroxylase-like FAD-dependent oxidoreductase
MDGATYCLDVVQVQFRTRVESIHFPEKEGQSVVVTTSTTGQDGEPSKAERFTCRLLIAADGANSTVRNALQKAQPGAGWEMEVYPSDAGGLAYKVWCSLNHAYTSVPSRSFCVTIVG